MTCQEYQSFISFQMDGEMTPAEIVQAERHLEACPRCAAVYLDLKKLVEESQQLPLFEPPARLWTSLRRQLESEQLIRPSVGWISRWVGTFQLPAMPQLVVATSLVAVLMIVSSFWVIRGLKFAPHSPSSKTFEEIQAANEVRQAEEHYLAAINSLAKITETRMEQMDPALKGVLEDNLATIDYYIDKCRETVKNEPTNVLAQRYLLEAYRKKVDLLESIVHSDVL